MSKIIKAVFTGRFCKTQRVFQFDTDDKIQFVNVDLPANYTVDFANSKTGDSVSVLATSDTVQIPPDLFVPGSEIYAWIWLSDSNGGHTRCEATIPIDPRAQRSNTEPTPAQASAWDEAVDTLNEAAEDYAEAMGHGPQIIDGFWYIWDNTAGEYVNTNVKAEGENGEDGTQIWWTTGKISTPGGNLAAVIDYFAGGTGSPKVGDYLFGNPPGQAPSENNITYLYSIINIIGSVAALVVVSSLKGKDGEDGTDGVSPTISSASITGGHRLTITDAGGTTTVDVMDGTNGTDGSDGTTFTPSVSDAGVISWSNDGGKQNPESVDLVAAVLAALPTWEGGSF